MEKNGCVLQLVRLSFGAKGLVSHNELFLLNQKTLIICEDGDTTDSR